MSEYLKQYQESIRSIVKEFHIDWVTGVMIGLFALVQGMAVSASMEFEIPKSSPVAGNPYDWRAVIAIAAMVVIGGLVFGGMYLLNKRLKAVLKKYLPDWLLTDTNYLKYIALGYVSAWGVKNGYAMETASTLAIAYVLWKTDLAWIPFNGFVLLISAVAAATLGSTLAPPIIMAVLIAVALVDHFEVNMTGIMDRAATASLEWHIPNFVIIPTKLRFSMSGIGEMLEDGEKEERHIATLIGSGDFVLPTTLPVSVAVFGGSSPAFFGLSWPVIGAIAGTVAAVGILRSRVKTKKDTTPGIPYLGAGAIIGLLFGVAISGDPWTVALGIYSHGPLPL